MDTVVNGGTERKTFVLTHSSVRFLVRWHYTLQSALS